MRFCTSSVPAPRIYVSNEATARVPWPTECPPQNYKDQNRPTPHVVPPVALLRAQLRASANVRSNWPCIKWDCDTNGEDDAFLSACEDLYASEGTCSHQ